MKEKNIEVYIHPVLTTIEQEYFRSKLPNNFILKFNDGTNEFSLAQDCAIAIGNFNTEWIELMPNLTTVLLDSVGTDNFNNYQWKTNTISVHNLQHFFSIPVAEEIIAGILNIYRKLPELQDAKKEKCWIKDNIRFQKKTLNEARVVLFGYGSVGKQVHKLLTTFGSQVTVFDYLEKQQQRLRLIESIKDHDILIVTVPATAETIDIIDQELLSHTKKDFIFVNAGRGQVVNENDLINKAKSDPSFTACLDVTKIEPLPPKSELWDCDNIYLTQHTGGGSNAENLKKINVYLKQINLLVEGTPLENEVLFKNK